MLSNHWIFKQPPLVKKGMVLGFGAECPLTVDPAWNQLMGQGVGWPMWLVSEFATDVSESLVSSCTNSLLLFEFTLKSAGPSFSVGLGE